MDDPRAMIEQLFMQARRHNERASLNRIEECLLGITTTPGDPLQRPGFLFLPFLSRSPWHRVPDSEWVRAFEFSADSVRRECLDLLTTRRGFQPYAEPPGSRDFWEGQWEACYLMHSNRVFERACAACPVTHSLLRSVPRLDEYAFFSVLEPGGRIGAHCGPWNARLTLHFGIQIPADCAIRVGSEARRWEEGSFLAFDDSFEHEVHNASLAARVVLVFAVWHPDLTEIEIEVLRQYDRIFPLQGHDAYVQSLFDRSLVSFDGQRVATPER